MYKGTTPTYSLTFPDGIDFSPVNVYVTFAKSNRQVILTKENDDLDIQQNVINVFLTQEETLSLPLGCVIQVNWTYLENGVTKRACSDIVGIPVRENLVNEVL